MTSDAKTIEAARQDVMVWTDLEPDDVIGIWVALALGGRGRIRLCGIVVGEGDVQRKVQRMEQYVRMLREAKLIDRDPLIIAGIGTAHRFARDGAEFDKLSATVAPAVAPVAAVQAALELLVAVSDHPTLWLLKPPRELLAMHPAMASKLLAHCEVLAYGGFNFRSVLDRQRPDESRAALYAMLGACKRVVLYESFHATGQVNSATPATMPLMFKALDAAIAGKC